MEAAQKRLTEGAISLMHWKIISLLFGYSHRRDDQRKTGQCGSVTAYPATGGSWDLPDGLIDRIECCGLMVPSVTGCWKSPVDCLQPGKSRHYAALVGKPLCAATDAPE